MVGSAEYSFSDRRHSTWHHGMNEDKPILTLLHEQHVEYHTRSVPPRLRTTDGDVKGAGLESDTWHYLHHETGNSRIAVLVLIVPSSRQMRRTMWCSGVEPLPHKRSPSNDARFEAHLEMPRPKKEGAAEPKRRSRHGCWPCKSRKIKCGEERPGCENCSRLGDTCDYSIRLNWGGRTKRKDDDAPLQWVVTPPQSFQKNTSTTPSASVPSNSSHPTTSEQTFSLPASPQPASNPVFSAAPPAIPIDPWFTPSMSVAPPGHPPYDPNLNMPPPLFQWAGADTLDFGENQARKRRKTDSQSSPPTAIFSPPVLQISQLHGLPMTPDSPKLYGDPMSRSKSSDSNLQSHQTPELRRLSVKSLLSDADDITPNWQDDGPSQHGFDQGRHDIDTPRNDDLAALTVFSPSSTLRKLHTPNALTPPDADYFTEFGFGLRPTGDPLFQLDEYYSQPVAVQIPKSLEPLPKLLHANPMNLLYFHHFLNHTARILVPHDCPENPFRTILPRMACSDSNLLNLLLAYSASHRARLLKHPEPRNRIAAYMDGVFTSLQEALFGDDPSKSVTDANLATAIMLASLEIISPNAFEVPVSWQTHLQIAHKMITARGGYQRLLHSSPVAYFLARWFAYLDVVGSLSGSRYERGVSAAYDDDTPDADLDATIDCLLGFRSGAVTLLARVADMATRCDEERIADNGALVEDWTPSEQTVEEAQRLEATLKETQRHTEKRCSHHSDAPISPEALAETAAINEAYHLTGLIHLYCRVLGHARTSPSVQDCVSDVIRALGSIRVNGSAEACMVLPMFTAGCEAIDQAQRDKIKARFTGLESSGMSQVHKARNLMQQVWDTGNRWETLVRAWDPKLGQALLERPNVLDLCWSAAENKIWRLRKPQPRDRSLMTVLNQSPRQNIQRSKGRILLVTKAME
ncbi:hypothetical protein FH972_021146 [Carpinus fangiana]|uniref:Zn(2)-C6 fungal-type domain-containing protein n=1 Tax=Carpinus fangiana TaxID=176857 RepID=A0A5N6KNH4_9ROSI|nr:hypothetical protein FH972_021146 [Carpinus fangiana]